MSRTFKITAAIIAVIGLIASIGFVALSVTDTGAGSPTEAARRLITAVEQNDPVGALESITVTERNLLRNQGYTILSELERLGLVAAFDHSRVPGAAVTSDALVFTTKTLGDAITAVDVVGGRLKLDLSPAQPVTASAQEILRRDFDIVIEGRTYVRDFAQYPLRLVTVDDGSGWQVSVAYSVAEALRGAAPDGQAPTTPYVPRQGSEAGTIPTLPDPKFASPVASTGSPTAEGAVRKFVQALVELEHGQAVALIVPDEAAVFRDYLPLLEAQSKPLAGSAVNNLNVIVTGDGAERAVQLTSLEIDLIGEVQNLHLTYTGRCYQAAYRFGANDAYVAFERCNDAAVAAAPAPASPTGDSPEDEAREAEARRQALLAGGATQVRTGESPPRDNLFNALAVFGGGVDFPTFVVVERNERWYISPARTILDSTLATLRRMQPDGTSALTDRLRRSVAPDANLALLREARDPDNALFGPKVAVDQPLIARCFTDILATIGDAGVATYGPQCLRELVKANRLEPGAVEGMVLFGECLTVSHQGPPDASHPIRRFYLADRAVRACLQAHIDAGDAPPESIERMNRPADQTCYLAYQALAPDAPESDWAAADLEAQRCVEDSVVNKDSVVDE